MGLRYVLQACFMPGSEEFLSVSNATAQRLVHQLLVLKQQKPLEGSRIIVFVTFGGLVALNQGS